MGKTKVYSQFWNWEAQPDDLKGLDFMLLRWNRILRRVVGCAFGGRMGKSNGWAAF